MSSDTSERKFQATKEEMEDAIVKEVFDGIARKEGIFYI